MKKNKSNSRLISVILITYNRMDDLIECIESLRSQKYGRFEIIVVDNNSTDGTPEQIGDRFPNVNLIRLDENLGVAGARNVGFRHARGDIHVVIDDDCIVKDPDLLTKVDAFFEHNDGVGILAFRILNYDTGKISRHEFPHKKKRRDHQMFETTYFVGAGHAIRRELFEKIGYLYEAYFFTFEEMDFSWRALEAGYRIVYSPDVTVYHKASASARPSWRKVYYSMRNRFWFCYTFLPWYYIITHMLIWGGYFFMAALRANQLRKYFSAIGDGFKGLPGLKDRRKQLRLSADAIQKIRQMQGRLSY